MSKINNMRSAYNIVRPDMDVKDFIEIAGVPDNISGSLSDGVLTWTDGVWKGILRGGTIYRKVILFVKNGKIIQCSTENLDVSNW